MHCFLFYVNEFCFRNPERSFPFDHSCMFRVMLTMEHLATTSLVLLPRRGTTPRVTVKVVAITSSCWAISECVVFWLFCPSLSFVSDLHFPDMGFLYPLFFFRISLFGLLSPYWIIPLTFPLFHLCYFSSCSFLWTSLCTISHYLLFLIFSWINLHYFFVISFLSIAFYFLRWTLCWFSTPPYVILSSFPKS